MHAYLPVQSIYRELRTFPVRKAIGIVALIAASAVLALRIRELNRPRRVELGPRAEMLIIVRGLATRVNEYAEQYGRPIYMVTRMHHVSPAESTLYETLRRDLYDNRIRYTFGDEGFTISWDNGTSWDRLYRGPMPIAQSFPWTQSASTYNHARWVAYAPR